MNNRGGCKGQTAEYHGPLFGRNTRPPLNHQQNDERLDYGCVTASARLVREAMMMFKSVADSLTLGRVCRPVPTNNNLALESRRII